MVMVRRQGWGAEGARSRAGRGSRISERERKQGGLPSGHSQPEGPWHSPWSLAPIPEQDLCPHPAIRCTPHLPRQGQQRQHAEAHHQQQREGDQSDVEGAAARAAGLEPVVHEAWGWQRDVWGRADKSVTFGNRWFRGTQVAQGAGCSSAWVLWVLRSATCRGQWHKRRHCYRMTATADSGSVPAHHSRQCCHKHAPATATLHTLLLLRPARKPV